MERSRDDIELTRCGGRSFCIFEVGTVTHMTFVPSPISQSEDVSTGWLPSLPSIISSIFLVAVLVGLFVLSEAQHLAVGIIGGQTVTTTVDSELAGHYLGTRAAPRSAASELIETIVSRYDEKPLNHSTLQQLATETSLDFATIYFSRRVLSQSDNSRLQQRFLQELRRWRVSVLQPTPIEISHASYRILFVPGFHYRSDPHTGADFDGPRTYLNRFGFDTALIETQEDGTVEENAEIVANDIRRESSTGRSLIVVSTSKGGVEAAVALGRLLDDKELESVKAWVSIGGLLRGTYLADHAIVWWKRWFVGLAFWVSGIDDRSLPGLTVQTSRKRFASLTFPKQLYMLQYVAVPLSGQVSRDVMDRYRELSAFGPNDGLTLLADELLPGGHVILEPGLDHFYRDRDINLKALALAIVVMRETAEKERREDELQ